MVVVASSQPNELEQKKKRQTLERARANHLSKQLQMRLRYAKLKVEHGWQRQNLNEVENLYFHHSHLRSVRLSHVAGQPHNAAVVPTPELGDTTIVPSATPSLTEQPVGPSSSNGLEPASPPPEHATSADGQSPSPPPQAPALAALGSSTAMPPSAFDLGDPHILARLAQLQAQIQMPSQSQSTPRQPMSPIAASQPTSLPVLMPGPSAALTVFPPHIQSPQPPNHSHPVVGVPFSAYPLQSFIGTSSVPLYPIPIPSTSSVTPHNPTMSASPLLTPTSTATTPIPTTQTSIAPTALTYDSFWSTHASSTGPTRALYRTYTGFSASATPTGNVAMLTPGGNAAIMTADGVYVGGATSRSG